MLSQDVMSRLSLTTHFREAWEKKMKTPVPTISEVKQMIAESKFVQKYKLAYTARGRPLVFPEVYVNREAGVAIKVDWNERRPKVVTVIDL